MAKYSPKAHAMSLRLYFSRLIFRSIKRVIDIPLLVGVNQHQLGREFNFTATLDAFVIQTGREQKQLLFLAQNYEPDFPRNIPDHRDVNG